MIETQPSGLYSKEITLVSESLNRGLLLDQSLASTVCRLIIVP